MSNKRMFYTTQRTSHPQKGDFGLLFLWTISYSYRSSITEEPQGSTLIKSLYYNIIH